MPLLKKLITEILEAFDTGDIPITDAFQVLNPKNIPINLNLDYGIEEIDKVVSFYGNNKISFKERELKQHP